MLDHVRVEASDVERSARFYDALFHALGARRLRGEEGEVAWGVTDPVLRMSAAVNGNGNGHAHGHVALRVPGKAAVEAAYEAALAAGGIGDAPPAPRPAGGLRCYAAVLRDPDGVRVELVSR